MSRLTARDNLQNLAARLQAARQAQQIYPPSHPQLEQAMQECYAGLKQVLGDGQQIQIAVAEGEFILGNIQVPAEGEMLAVFASTLSEFGINRLVFDEAVELGELHRFLDILSGEAAEVLAGGGIEAALAAAEVVNIEAGALGVDTSLLPDPDVLFRTWEAYSTGLKAVRAIKNRARETGTVGDVAEIREFAYRITELAMQETRPLLAAHALKAHDEYSFTHSVNVSMMTLAMARNLPFNQNDLHEIAVAALLHDVGKEAIPREILNKPGKLTDDEWEIVNRHGVEGARMLAKTEGVGKLATVVALEHHLAYHQELRDESTWQPNLVSQIVCLADVYDALRSKRPYRDELPSDKAMRIMLKEGGEKFDPTLLEGFYRMVGLYPPGTVVRLESGALAVCLAGNPEHPELPQVIVVGGGEVRTMDDQGEALNLASPAVEDAVAEVVAPEEAGVNPLDYL